MKCDIHRHFGGSIRPETVWKIINNRGIQSIANSLPDLRKMMVCDNSTTFLHFLDKFRVLDMIKWDNELIDMSVDQVCYDIKQEGIDYCEMSLSLNKYISNLREIGSVLSYIYSSFKKYSSKYHFKIGLLLSIKYDSNKHFQIANFNIINTEYADMVVGLDFVGDESFFDYKFIKPMCDIWKSRGKQVRLHVAEVPGKSRNLGIAVDYIAPTRIAHGIYGNPVDYDKANNLGIIFDLALHSNYYTGSVFPNIGLHPLKDMIKYGCNITLNADDPVQFQCTLDDEYRLAITSGLASESQVNVIKQRSELYFKEIMY